ncbi:MAG: hypothetical protein KDN22_30555 [Verrucomicrobiae bacterium]|nr:hypothetical protein [Verrucomicrobiae bacterium]
MSAPHIFGVRHLSPSGGWHLRRYLDEVKPKVVLIEGLSDAGELIADMVRAQTKPPIAILAFTDCQPVRTLVYPMSNYCAEYQALVWAKENKARADFIDLPSSIFLALQGQRESTVEAPLPDFDQDVKAKDETVDEIDEASVGLTEPDRTPEPDKLSLYDRFARSAGEDNYETYWERRFEHNLTDHSYRLAAYEFGRGLRELDDDSPHWRAENLVREAYMRRCIAQVIASGTKPEDIVVVCGAFHASVLDPTEHPAMSDAELGELPTLPSKLTLMPYSYFKLSSQSGYGAGNKAPAYFELLWDCLEKGDLHHLPALYLSSVVRHMRKAGTHRSTAEVIEAVRLAKTLSAMRGGLAPTLADLQDAAITLIGHGERASVAEALARVEVGTSVGSLPKGVSRTSIQEDFEREMEGLKLAKYQTTTAKQDLGLDLRENRRVKSEEAAWLDLNRSFFLHRLAVLGVGFAKKQPAPGDNPGWAEKWVVQWTPECEINLVEAVLLGETVELATAFRFRQRLDNCLRVGDAAEVVRDACECGMMESMETARSRLQALASESSEFVSVAHAAHELGMIARYGDIRRFDASPLLPLVDELFVSGALALGSSANCDNEAAKEIVGAMEELNRVSLEYHDRVDEELWVRALTELSDADDRNPVLSGYACAILLERNVITSEELAREVSRRLSPGIDADLGAGWFEGLSRRNRYALLARLQLWEQLAAYVESLDDEQFKRALVFLRRAFGSFSPQEKRSIAENLGEIWGIGADQASEMLSNELTEREEEKLKELDDFDFSDL